MHIELDDLSRAPVRALVAEHLADMRATSPPESIHALDLSGLTSDDITVWTLWDGQVVLGCIALKELSPTEGEVKSMRTAATARRRGVAGQLLRHLVNEARSRGYDRLSLETGAQDFFDPARRLYLRHGFVYCPAFADYRDDPNSVFLTAAI